MRDLREIVVEEEDFVQFVAERRAQMSHAGIEAPRVLDGLLQLLLERVRLPC